MLPVPKPFITHADKSPAFWQIGILWQVMATSRKTLGKFTLLDQIVGVEGGGPTTHSHAQEEALYIVKGKATFNAGGIHGIEAGPGTLVVVPGLCEHSFRVEEKDTRILNMYIPAGFETILMAIARPAEKREPPPRERIQEMLPPRWILDILNDDYGVDNTCGRDAFIDPPDPNSMSTVPTPGATVFPFAANISEKTDNIHFGNALWGLLASNSQTGGSYCMFEVWARQGMLFRPCSFDECDIMLFVLTGELNLYLSDEPEKAKAGALVWIPRGTVHSIRTESEEARILYLHTPGGFEEYIQQLGTPAKSNEIPSASFKDRSVEGLARQAIYRAVKMRDVPMPDPFEQLAWGAKKLSTNGGNY